MTTILIIGAALIAGIILGGAAVLYWVFNTIWVYDLWR